MIVWYPSSVLPAPTSTDAPVELDRAVCKEFWEQRALIANDPRSVTLDHQAAWTMRFEVSLYQGWLLRRIRTAHTPTVVDLACGNGDWTTVARAEAIGHMKIDRFAPVTASKVRLRILSSAGAARIREFQLFDVAGAR